MTRANRWLPGADNIEPGGDHDQDAYGYRLNNRITPLEDVLSAIVLVFGAAVVAIWVFGFVPRLNLGAILVASGAILVFLGVGIFTLQRGLRRWAWRRSHTAQTGGRYLRAWQRYRPSDWT